MSASQFDIVGSGVTEHLAEQKLKTLQVKCHIGLGDAFIMQGMIHKLVMTAKYRKVIINTRKKYIADIDLLYHHIRSMIDIQTHTTYDEAPPDREDADEILRLGFYSDDKSFLPKAFDREFYRQAGIPFINRWLHCYIPTPSRTVKRRDFTIRHHDPHRGFVMEGLKPDIDIVPSESKPLLDWVPELMAAKEIHCIDSCVLNLVESMHALQMVRPDVKLVYHEYARQENPPTLLAPWRTLK